MNDLVCLGKLTKDAFQKLYPPQESKELSQEDLKDFLEELGLAYRIHCSLDDPELFVTSMICDGNEESMREKLDTMKKGPRFLSIVFSKKDQNIVTFFKKSLPNYLLEITKCSKPSVRKLRNARALEK